LRKISSHFFILLEKKMKLGELYNVATDERSQRFKDVEFKYGTVENKSVFLIFDNWRIVDFVVSFNGQEQKIRLTHNKKWDRELAQFLNLPRDLILKVKLDGLKVYVDEHGDITEESLRVLRISARDIFLENNK
jgi:hypothetical protein